MMLLCMMMIIMSILAVLVVSSDSMDTIITCGSVVKLESLSTKDAVVHEHYYLRSSGISWGSGAGQQIVTVRKDDNQGAGDARSTNDAYWLVEGPSSSSCVSGDNIKCGSIIRLKHVSTNKYLHSHRDTSNLSGQQEVTGYDGGDDGDDWIIDCITNTGVVDDDYWLYNTAISLRHRTTGKYLTSSSKYQYHEGNCPGCPIIGDREVACGSSSKDNEWKVAGGMIITQQTPDEGDDNDEGKSMKEEEL
ncbi:Stromal cell-derived factor 2-like protein 1 [Perkinsus olseni]|uniref:Stromal cell-derived factor 2-like protein 1 n=3 Tax=Perkinsus olseni TaxID=32597 RepID=A0A7J6N4Y0_PEROL|nr:Stromal cell-derived factor 2-like protein 1 [Perkinsus olseni]